MEIHFNPNLPPVGRTSSDRPAIKQAGETSDASFPAAAALEQALRALPEHRGSVVEPARLLVRDAHYPPQETIQKIAALLASYLSSSDIKTP
jgi:hypothetical protein